MDLTKSYRDVVPASLLERYDFRETRNAATVLRATNPGSFEDILAVLDSFWLSRDDMLPGGNKSDVASRLDTAFRERGWREGRHDTRIESSLKRLPWLPAGELAPTLLKSEVLNEGYKVDNVKGRLAVDVEWNAKDGNHDRDLAAYRALYEAGILDGAAIITRTQDDLRARAATLGVARWLATTTTTNLAKLVPRLTRGDSGGCPLLVAAITARCLR